MHVCIGGVGWVCFYAGMLRCEDEGVSVGVVGVSA